MNPPPFPPSRPERSETPAVRVVSDTPRPRPSERLSKLRELLILYPGTVIFLLFVLPLIVGVPLGLGQAFWKLVEPLFKAAGY